ncbi:MAG: hypothetical protein LBV08_08820 [Clostridiales bacterium]|nr:hypothetical protein [Clostridiales bacterium]
MKNKLAAALFTAILMTACSNQAAPNENVETPSGAVATDETGTGPDTGSANWVGIYSEILNGQNGLGIDFTNYSVGDESDVTGIRQFGGCGLYDLDGDGIPELFISIRLWEGGFYHLFTIENGGGKYIGESEGDLIEKSTGTLFGIAGESGYTPDIAYEYIDGSLVEIPGYVQPIPETYSGIMLGGNELALDSEGILRVEVYESLEEAANNYSAAQ